MFIIGIDPHKASHTATVIDGDETVIGELRIAASRSQRQTLVEWATPFVPRSWAIEGASGVGALLAQQLVDAGEVVFDVSPALSARRVCWIRAARTRPTRTMLAPGDRRVTASELAVRRAGGSRVDLGDAGTSSPSAVRGTTRSVCRLHAELSLLVEGGQGRKLSAKQAAIVLDNRDITTCVERERTRIAGELLDEVRHHDQHRRDLQRRIRDAVDAADTTVTDIDGVGPIVAAYLIGHSGDVRRFATAGHYARYNATAPIEASSGPRASPVEPERQPPTQSRDPYRGQISRNTPGRVYYLRERDEGKKHQRSAALLEATDQRRRLHAPTRRPQPLNQTRAREGTQGRL